MLVKRREVLEYCTVKKSKFSYAHFLTYETTTHRRKPLKISQNIEETVDVKFEDLQIWFHKVFRYLSRFFTYSEKSVSEKSLSRATGRKSDLWNRESPLGSTVGSIFPQNQGWGCFLRYFEPLCLKNGWGYQNKFGCIKSSSAPFSLFFLNRKSHSQSKYRNLSSNSKLSASKMFN